jgi:hypothetical protein
VSVRIDLQPTAAPVEGGQLIGADTEYRNPECLEYFERARQIEDGMELPSGTTAGPMTYMLNGKQFIVVSIGARPASEVRAIYRILSSGQSSA